jgi:amino acid transporter
VSAGLYLAGFLNEVFQWMGLAIQLPTGATAAAVAVVITLYFWWENTKGIPESSTKALRIMYFTTAMVVVLLLWSGYTLWMRGAHLPPLPIPENLKFADGALGWLRGTHWPSIGAIGILIALGHSVLAMSGEETLAQVYREIEHPKLKNLKRAGFIIVVYSILFTAGSAMLASMIIPQAERSSYFDNIIGGLAMHLEGPLFARLAFHAFVVFVGVLMLAGAVNTAIIGSNGVLNRVSEDGILPAWFRRPHARFGTSYRMINVIVLLQIVTIILSRGDIFLLGEAYAFGVMWSFATKGIAVLVLRLRSPHGREYKVPLNLNIAGREIPLGLIAITVGLTALCIVNLLTKQVATLSGIAFTLVFFAIFTATERLTAHKADAHVELDEFNLNYCESLSQESLAVRPGGVLVAVNNPESLEHLASALERYDARHRDIGVLYVRVMQRAASGEHGLEAEQLFGTNEQHLFSKALALAEKSGKPIHPAVIAASDLQDAVLRTAQSLRASFIVLGHSAKSSYAEQARQMGLAWERLVEPKLPFIVEIVEKDGSVQAYPLGPHPPVLTPKEVKELHELWLRCSKDVAPLELHHHDLVHFALEEVQRELAEGKEEEVLRRLRKHVVLAHAPH